MRPPDAEPPGTPAAGVPGWQASCRCVGSSFAAWLAWDMADYGLARRWYGSSIKAAHASGDKLLAAYQTGSLAGFDRTSSATRAKSACP
ncbi:hypothetical protein [Streptomyces sp. NPDC002785]|uniref:hypothetical protein n=1 Tax=Streptomyces sp. NPDC002785 TaxID=3154543 RepID=UPI003320C159